MYRLLSLSISLILVAGIPAGGQTPEEIVALGDSLYDLYDYHGSISYYRQACSLDSNRFESFWKLGRSLNLKGETTPKDSQLAVFEEARDAEKRALELNEADADAHFQLARALGKIALFKGIFKSASLAKQVRKEADRALQLDSLHDGAWHILGRWHREVGKKPKILRIPMGLGAANKGDALSFMKKAVELNPEYVNHHLEMGITYLRFKDKDRARMEFERTMELPSQRPLDEKYKSEAEKYLAEMDRK
jgi:tetratricopeptide (TPR) repeat protein